MEQEEKARAWLGQRYDPAQEFGFELVVELLAEYKIVPTHRLNRAARELKHQAKKAEQKDMQRLTCHFKTQKGNVFDSLQQAEAKVLEVGKKGIEAYECSICHKFHIGSSKS